jgi:outer membrane protein OmpA-like peptidoglycan-associated protein
MGNRKILKSIGMVAGMGFLLVLNSTVYGQEEDELMMRRGASTDEIMGTLRSIRRPKSEGTPRALAVRIYFAHDSAELTPETKAELANYGESLVAGEFRDARWAIEGHTDTSGSAAYNQVLSERRARSVYNYLIREFGVNPDRLVPLGKGESDLFDSANPLSGENRRVRITYLGG